MKKVKLFVFTIMLVLIGIGSVSAASLGVKTSTTSTTVGNTITITVNASGAAGWEYCLTYDASLFKLTSAGSDTGGACVKTGSTLIGYSSVKFKFKSIKSGTGTFSLRDAAMYGDDGIIVASSKGSVSVRARTQAEIQASYSNNDNLKNLVVEGFEISPAFNKDTLEYELEVENNVTNVNIIASRAESHASVVGAGNIALSEGLNKVNIVVTAQKGNQKVYVININRKELDPINVIVDDKNYTVVRKVELLEIPLYYEATTTTIDSEEVPALKSDVTKYVLVGLKDEDGNIQLYRYNGDETYRDSVSEIYERYYQFNTEVINFTPTKPDTLIDGFDKTKKIKINDEEIEVYYDSSKNFVLIYGMNMNTGNTGWYQYDVKENTFQRYNDRNYAKLEKDNKLYFILMCVGGAGFAISLLSLILLGTSRSKMKKKNAKMLEMLEELNNKVKGSNVASEEVKNNKNDDKKKKDKKEVKKEDKIETKIENKTDDKKEN